jgi:alkylhydroperoxidase family enzyme
VVQVKKPHPGVFLPLIIPEEGAICMPRIPPDDSVRLPEFADASFATMGTMMRVLAHRPQIMQQVIKLLQATMREGTVEPKLKELLAIRVSQVNHCFY